MAAELLKLATSLYKRIDDVKKGEKSCEILRERVKQVVAVVEQMTEEDRTAICEILK